VSRRVSPDLQTSSHRSGQAIITPAGWRVAGLGDALWLAWVTPPVRSQKEGKYEKQCPDACPWIRTHAKMGHKAFP